MSVQVQVVRTTTTTSCENNNNNNNTLILLNRYAFFFFFLQREHATLVKILTAWFATLSVTRELIAAARIDEFEERELLGEKLQSATGDQVARREIQVIDVGERGELLEAGICNFQITTEIERSDSRQFR